MDPKQAAEMLHQEHLLAEVKEEPPEEQPEITSFCYETVNKEEVILQDDVEQADDQPESKRKRTEPEQAAKNGPKGSPQIEENCSSFCYEMVMKEELIIEDDSFGDSAEDEQREDSRNSWEDDQLVEDEAISRQEIDSLSGYSALNKFKCDVCQKILVSKHNLDAHKKLHEKRLDRLECQKCHEIFDDRYSFLMHNKIHKNLWIKPQYEELLEQDKSSQIYTCLLCDKSCTNRTRALAHVLGHMNLIEGTYQCKICGVRCARKHSYQLHMSRLHKNSPDQMAPPEKIEGVYADHESSSNEPCEVSDLPLHCKTCDVFFNNKTNLNIHLWKFKLKIIQSKIAAEGKELSERKKNPIPNNTSKVEMDNDGFYNCFKCDYRTNQLKAFRSHIRAHKVYELGLYTCDVCQIRFTRRAFLDTHKKTHREKISFECQTCHENFANRAEVARHRHRVHSKNEHSRQFTEQVTVDEKGVFTCPFCGRTDTNRNYAYQHFRRHVLDKFVCKIERKGDKKNISFPCSICKEIFDTRVAYHRHKKSHNSNIKVFLGLDDLYHCTRCEETFPTMGPAYTHFKKHDPSDAGISKDLPFKCSECNKTFHQAKELQRCQYTHKVIKLERNKCKVCGKCFVSRHKLGKHERIHNKAIQLSRSEQHIQKHNEADVDPESTDSASSSEDEDK